MTKHKPHEWYTFLGAGRDPRPARGPHRGREAAEAALRRFCEQYGWRAGTYLAAGHVLLAGPYATRREALAADISEPGAPARRVF